MRLPLIGLAIALTSLAHAWIDTGHMVVAAIAEKDLTLGARREALRLLSIGGEDKSRDFLGAACWADDTKTAATGPWHYINIHFKSDGTMAANKPLAENVAWAIDKFEAVLKDKNKPDRERADALRYLMHFVGDINQPMHGIARDSDAHPDGDRGGNDFTFEEFPLAGFNVRNLHFLWDIAGGLYGSTERPLKDRSPLDKLADSLRAENPRDQLPELATKNPMGWAIESMTIAQAVCYATPEHKKPSEAYLAMARYVCGRRLALAGYRLADELNRLLG